MGRGAAQRARFDEDLVGQVADYAIIGLDPRGTITSWNLGAERVKGYRAEEAIGRSFRIFYTPDDRRIGLPLTLLARARTLGSVESTGWRVRKDGSLFWADVIITALHDKEGVLTGYTKVTRDVTEQHELEMELRASEERFRLLVDQVVDYAIIALDPEGTIETWNLGAARVKGYRAEEAIGRSFAIFYTEEDREAGLPLRLLAEARENGRVKHSGWRVRKDGSRFWGDVVITAVHDDLGRLTGFAKITRDRSDLKALEEAQDAFYAAFYHDFRSPITALKGFIEVARDADDDTRAHFIDRAENSADRLLGMVEDLVHFARQRGARSDLDLSDVDVAQVARAAVRALPTELDPSRVAFTGGDGTFARANDQAMHRVVMNLVSNALKYSPSSSPVLVQLARPRPGWLQLKVSDRGRGIDPDDLHTIFDEFARGRLAQEDGGTGVGLASVRELVEQQHGVVAIANRDGGGVTVSVELPAPPVSRPTFGVQRSSTAAAPGPLTTDGQPSG